MHIPNKYGHTDGATVLYPDLIIQSTRAFDMPPNHTEAFKIITTVADCTCKSKGTQALLLFDGHGNRYQSSLKMTEEGPIASTRGEAFEGLLSKLESRSSQATVDHRAEHLDNEALRQVF